MLRCDANFQCFFSFKSPGKFEFDLKYEFCCKIHQILHIHHKMEYLTELFFVRTDFLITPLLTTDFSLNPKKMYFYMHTNFCA